MIIVGGSLAHEGSDPTAFNDVFLKFLGALSTES